MKFTRRDIIRRTGGRRRRRSPSAARSSARRPSPQSAPTYTPEEGATLRLLRWSPFVQGRGGRRGSPTPRSSPTRPASQVRIDKESWEDIRPKAAVAANVGSGPDMMLSLVRRPASSIPTSCST